MNTALPNIGVAIPEIFVFSMACVILMVDLFLSERRRVVSYILSQLTLVVAAVLTIKGMSHPSTLAFNGMFVHDDMASIIKFVIYVVVIFTLAYSRGYLRDRGMYRGEYFVLALFGVVGMMIMASASHLLTLYLGLELMSLCLYSMIAFQRDSKIATEAAMKYFVLGALASGILLYGMSILYGLSGSLEISVIRKTIATMDPGNVPLIFGLVFVIVGLVFKLGAVPFHMWVPDVYHGAPSATTLYVSTAPKIAAFAMIMRLLIGGLEELVPSWQDMLVIIAVLSMAVGNLVAIAQTNIKRMLAYSAISHTGFFLLGILSATENGYSSAMFYILVYAVMSLGGFGMITLLSRKGFEAERLADFKGLNKRNAWYAAMMLVLMFSMAGVPPTVGFYAKLMVIQSVIDVDMVWLAVVAVLFAVIGAYYYIRVVKLMYFDEPEDTSVIRMEVDVRAMMGLNALGLIAIMPWVGAIIEICNDAIRAL